jgi:hypothetical protein
MKYFNAFIAILSLFFLVQSETFAQNDNKMANIVFPSDSQINESQLVPLTAAELKEIQSSIELPSEYCLDHIKMRFEGNFDDGWLLAFKKYDFSGDGSEDLVFISYCGGMEYRNYFWVKKDNKYYYSGLMIGKIVKFYRTQDSKALSAVARSGWDGSGYSGSIDLFAPEIKEGKFKYELQKRVKEFEGITIPDKRMPVRRFIVKNDKYKLRTSPIIIDKYNEDESNFERKPVYGNTLAEFSKGSKGVAIAEKLDETGRVWWFVIMDEDAKTGYNRFYDDQNASKAGWMSSRFLEVIN